MNCRLCGGACALILERPAPALTSMATLLDVPTCVHACAECGLLQSPALPARDAYYRDAFETTAGDADSADDDLMGIDASGAPILRLQRQAEVLSARLEPETGRLLDFGCGHGATLRWFRTHRPAWRVEGFEVASRYAAPDVTIGTIDTIPGGPFDAIAAFYVFEHLDAPVTVMRQLADRLAPGGRLHLAVPSAASNPVDVLAVDHVSHFDRATLARLLAAAGLALTACAADVLPATWLVEASAAPGRGDGGAADDGGLRSVPAYWRDADAAVTAFLSAHRPAPGTVAIYGAGVWGLALLTHPALPARAVACFADRNPRKQRAPFHGLPVVAPDAIPPTVDTVLIGVRPESAPAVESQPDLASFRRFTMPPWRAPCEA